MSKGVCEAVQVDFPVNVGVVVVTIDMDLGNSAPHKPGQDLRTNLRDLHLMRSSHDSCPIGSVSIDVQRDVQRRAIVQVPRLVPEDDGRTAVLDDYGRIAAAVG